MTKLRYFAWVRERIGKSEEEIDLPDELRTVSDLLTWLKSRGDGYETALQHQHAIRVAINQEHADHGEGISGAREIGLFPPMTGG